MGQDQQNSAQAPGGQDRSALQRKAQAGRAEHQARAMSVPKALRITLAKVANDLFGMAMAVIGARIEERSGDALSDLFEGPGLLVLLDGPQGRRAAAVLDPLLVGGLIQQQTMGKVMPDPGGEPRRLTATDAAICAPFLDALMQRAALLPEVEAERNLLEGYRFGARAEDARLLQMALEAPDYQIVHLTVDIGCGQRQGQITLCLPSIAPPPPVGPDGNKDEDDAAPGARPGALNDTVMGLNIGLNVALTRLTMPLSALGALKAGDVIGLGVSAFDQCRVLTLAGRGVGRGMLGQIDGQRAVRLDHARAVTDAPRRRASDRADLDLPSVKGNGTGTQGPPGDTHAVDVTLDNEDFGMQSLVDMPEMPDMSDLPGLTDDDPPADLQRIGAG